MQEIWKDIPDFEGLYQVSNLGRIKSLERYWLSGRKNILKRLHKEKILNGRLKGNYLQVRLSKNGKDYWKSIHRIVISTFLEKSNLDVNHKNGIKIDNKLENLEYCTKQENMQHAMATGLLVHKNGKKIVTLTPNQVYRIKWIKKYIKVEYGYWTKLAKSLNVSLKVISRICNNNSWKQLEIK
jgi:hypothetical protein